MTTNPGYGVLRAGIITNGSPSFILANGSGYGGGINYAYSTNHLQVGDVTMNNYLGLAAASFDVSSDESVKESITDWTGSATDLFRPVKVRQYRRKKSPGQPDVDRRTEIGLIAQEMPAGLAVPLGDGTLGIPLYDLVATVLKYAQEIDGRVALLEKGRKP
jgi:hypothetical protein